MPDMLQSRQHRAGIAEPASEPQLYQEHYRMKAFWLCACLSLLCLAPSPRAEPPKKEEVKKTEGKTFQVPYKLTEVKHVLIRAKINGKGPFNFILDTGAPALFVSTALAKKLRVEPDAK